MLGLGWIALLYCWIGSKEILDVFLQHSSSMELNIYHIPAAKNVLSHTNLLYNQYYTSNLVVAVGGAVHEVGVLVNDGKDFKGVAVAAIL